ncbi:MAG: c-type cytochrome [Rhodoferax sp.]|nr:c-type cytochrome [Rhodoferax sp.]
MNGIAWLPMLAMLAALSACSNLERSRDLANPDVPPAVTAMQVCSICHGVDGNSVSPNFPRLAGQTPGYIVAQLEIFRSHQRADPAGFEYMWGISHHLSDNQINGLAEYFARQVPKPNAPVDPQQMAAGKVIFENGVPDKQAAPCMACHGPKAQGMAAFPRLANQHQDYLMKQLNVFQRTDERPGTPMTQIAHLLSPQEIQAVAGYLQAFPGEQ